MSTMWVMDAKSDASLTAAAAAFEEELGAYSARNTEASRTPLTSEKGLARAKKALLETAECQSRLAAHLGALVRAIDAARDHQQHLMQETLGIAERIRDRTVEFGALMERFAVLGGRASEINRPVAAIIARKSQGAGAVELLPGLRDVLTQIDAIIEEAASLARDATDGGWSDVSREAVSLRQQMQSARNRLVLAERDMARQVGP